MPNKNEATSPPDPTQPEVLKKAQSSTGIATQITGSSEGEDVAAKLVDALIDTNMNLPAKSRLDDNEIMWLTRILVISARYGPLDLSKNAGVQFTFTFMKLRISRGGAGRNELVNLGEAMGNMQRAKQAAEAKEIKL